MFSPLSLSLSLSLIKAAMIFLIHADVRTFHIGMAWHGMAWHGMACMKGRWLVGKAAAEREWDEDEMCSLRSLYLGAFSFFPPKIFFFLLDSFLNEKSSADVQHC